MNDPIKDFVEGHREEFDHLEAPVLRLDQIKPKLQQIPALRKRSFFLLNGSKWLVAASILMTLTCAWFIFGHTDKRKPVTQLAGRNIKSIPKRVVDADSGVEVKPLMVVRKELKVKKDEPKTKLKTPRFIAPVRSLYAKLKDSTSASTRLLAILEIEESGKIDRNVMDMLASTLNNDGNTNVRLAALSLMQRYSEDEHVSTLLTSSLLKQGDPIVQLGLVSTLGKINNIDINNKLKSLVNSPETFAAVRDEAYRILLNQNKL